MFSLKKALAKVVTLYMRVSTLASTMIQQRLLVKSGNFIFPPQRDWFAVGR